VITIDVMITTSRKAKRDNKMLGVQQKEGKSDKIF